MINCNNSYFLLLLIKLLIIDNHYNDTNDIINGVTQNKKIIKVLRN